MDALYEYAPRNRPRKQRSRLEEFLNTERGVKTAIVVVCLFLWFVVYPLIVSAFSEPAAPRGPLPDVRSPLNAAATTKANAQSKTGAKGKSKAARSKAKAKAVAKAQPALQPFGRW